MNKCRFCTRANICGVCESVKKEATYPTESAWDADREREYSYRKMIAAIDNRKKSELEEFRHSRKILLAGQNRLVKADRDSRMASEYYWALRGFEDDGDDEIKEIQSATKRTCLKHISAVNETIYGEGTRTLVSDDGSVIIAHNAEDAAVVGYGA
jgi:hypothetical protein